MSALHPDWKEINDQQNKKHTISVVQEEVPIQSKQRHVSRKSAAVCGILLVVIGGFLAFFDYKDLLGQISNPDTIIIKITSEGFDQPSVRVRANQQIVWVNNGSDAQSLASKTLCNGENSCFATPVFLPGESAFFSVTSDLTPGQYDYFSTTNELFKGEIIIESDSANPGLENASSSLNILSTKVIPEIPAIDSALNTTSRTVSQKVASQPVLVKEQTKGVDIKMMVNSALSDGRAVYDLAPSAKSPAGSTESDQAVPTNPYVVNSNRTHPYDELGNRQSGDTVVSGSDDEDLSRHGAAPAQNPASQTVQPVALKKPFRQPDSGPELWVGSLLGALGLWLISRLLFGNIRVVIK